MAEEQKPTAFDEAFIRAMASIVITSRAQVGMLEVIANRLAKLEKTMTPVIDEHPKYVTLPDQGGFFTIQAGTTTVDFHGGKVTQPDGTIFSLRMNLKQFGIERMRSFMLVTATSCTVSFDGGGQWTLLAGEKLALGDFAVKEVYIQSATAGAIRLMAAVTPEFTVFFDQYFVNEFESTQGPLTASVYGKDLTAPQSIQLDLGATSGRMYVEAFGSSDVPTTFTLQTSNDGTHWFTVDTELTTAYSFGGGNTMEFLTLSSAAAGTAGNLVSLSLSALR